MEFQVLGAVEVRTGDRVLDSGPPQQRHVLAVLAASVGRPVSTEALIDRVWDNAPDGARRTLHVYVARLRRLLDGGTGHASIPRRSGGYVLDVDPDWVDVHRFARLVERARAPATTNPARIWLLREALGLWRGEPLAGLPGRWAEQHRQVWRRQHLDAVLIWAAAELRGGNHAAVVGRLTELAGEYPLVEPLAVLVMRALHGAGSAAEALDFYTQVRRRLADALGTDPGVDLQRIYQAILRGEPVDPPVDAPPSPAISVAASPAEKSPAEKSPAQASPAQASPAQREPVPALLPPDVYGFAGRTDQLNRLDALLDQSREQATAVVISAVSGTAGVGKTALAVHWAHRIAAEFPDGQLYVNLRGFDHDGQVMTPAEAVRGFLDAFGVAPARIPASLEAQSGLYRSVLSGKRVLVLLDNARDAEQVRPLLPGTPTALVLVTSRNQLTGLVATEGAHPLWLDVLSAAEAHELLARRLGNESLTAEPDAVEEIIACCARLPLALAVAAARVRQTGFRLATVAAELGSSDARLDALDTGDPTSRVRTVFTWSYRALTPDASRLFRLLGLHPGAEISVSAAASLGALPVSRARTLMTELAHANLVMEYAPGRYRIHDLLRAYAAELAASIDGEERRSAATQRLLDHYLHTAFDADRLLNPGRDPIELVQPSSGTSPEPLAERDQAVGWLTAEHATLVAAVHHAAVGGYDTHTWQLAWTLASFFDWQGHWPDWVAVQQAAVTATERLADRTAQARAHRFLALAYIRLGRFDDAYQQLDLALGMYRQIGDLTGQAHTHHSLAQVLEPQGQYTEAIAHTRQALEHYRVVGHRPGQARSLNAIGWYLGLRGLPEDQPEVLAVCHQALELLRDLDYRPGEAATWGTLGYAHQRLGQFADALRCYQNSLTIFTELGDRYQQAVLFTHIGDAHQATGNQTGAREAYQRALEIYHDLGHHDADTVRAKLAHVGPAPSGNG